MPYLAHKAFLLYCSVIVLDLILENKNKLWEKKFMEKTFKYKVNKLFYQKGNFQYCRKSINSILAMTLTWKSVCVKLCGGPLCEGA